MPWLLRDTEEVSGWTRRLAKARHSLFAFQSWFLRRTSMSKRILFVDDEPNILAGLERTLRPMRTQWEMEFVSGGDEALQALALDSFNAVVTDMRMPGMTGAQLLDKVRDQFPQTIRIVLSGQSDREAMVRSISSAHQFLSKP